MFRAVPCCAVTCQLLRCRAVGVPVGSTFARVVMLYRLPVCQQVTGRAVCAYNIITCKSVSLNIIKILPKVCT